MGISSSAQGFNTLPDSLGELFRAVNWRWGTSVQTWSEPVCKSLRRKADYTLSLAWSGAGTLEQAESLTPPDCQPARNQANPHTFSTTNLI